MIYSETLVAVILGALVAVGCSSVVTVERGRSRAMFADSSAQLLTPKHDLSLSVICTVVHVPARGAYRYSYVVTNDRTSNQPLNTFGIGPITPPISLGSPPHWLGGHGWEGDTTLVGWSVADSDTGMPIPDTGNISMSPYELMPGQSATFEIVSKHPKGVVEFFGQGFDTLAIGDDDVGPPRLNQEGVRGTIVGPVASSH